MPRGRAWRQSPTPSKRRQCSPMRFLRRIPTRTACGRWATSAPGSRGQRCAFAKAMGPREWRCWQAGSFIRRHPRKWRNASGRTFVFLNDFNTFGTAWLWELATSVRACVWRLVGAAFRSRPWSRCGDTILCLRSFLVLLEQFRATGLRTELWPVRLRPPRARPHRRSRETGHSRILRGQRHPLAGLP